MSSKALPEEAKPEQWCALRENEVHAFRQLWCEHYDRCLNHAASLFWEGFTCACCPLRTVARQEPPNVVLIKREETFCKMLECTSKKGPAYER